jgi:F-type H+-transporting ATPase subunit epsilon
MALRLSIVTPTRPLVDIDVDSVVAPGSEGEFGVLPGHAAFLIGLQPGVVSYTVGGRTRRVAVAGGFAEVTQERVTLLVGTAEDAEQIDAAEAERTCAAATQKLSELGFAAPPDEVEKARLELARARARVDARQG